MAGKRFYVHGNHIMSDPDKLVCGLRQGSALRHILLMIYALPLGRVIQHFENVSFHMFPDNIQLC